AMSLAQAPAIPPDRCRIRGGCPDSALAVLSPQGAGYDSSGVGLTTGEGGAVTVTRASDATCQDPSGLVRTLTTGQPCVSGGRLLVEPAATNLLLRSTALNDPSWTTSNASCTANDAMAPSGSNTAETCTSSVA